MPPKKTGKSVTATGGGSAASSTPLHSQIDAIFNPAISTLQRNQNARNLENHVTGGSYPHFNESRPPVSISRPRVSGHSYTSETYPNVMANINSVSTPILQSSRGPGSYMSTATLNTPIPTTQINYGGNTVNTGFTTHIGLYGQGSSAGFDRFATTYPNPPSPQISPPYNTPPYQPQTKPWGGKKP